MSNGCICCTIREDLRETLQLLAAKKRKGMLDFDRVVIETTGSGRPGPGGADLLHGRRGRRNLPADSIITLVDAKHARSSSTTARRRAARWALLTRSSSKTDLVSAEEVDALIHRLKHMNPRAPIKAVHFGEVPLSEVLDLRGFNLNAKLDIDPDFLKDDHDHSHCDHDHGQCEHDHDHGTTITTTMRIASTATTHARPWHHHHHHDDDVKSFVFRRACLRPGQAGRLPGRHRQHLRPCACCATRACCI